MHVLIRHSSTMLIACLAAMLSGCARNAPSLAEADPGIPSHSAIAPAVRGADNGLEVRWWVLDNQPERVARELWPYLNQPSPIDPKTLEHWRSNGLRLIAIPLADADSLRNRLPLLGRIDRHWLGQAPRWTELLQGEPLHNPIARNGQRVDMPPGRLRLLARAWTTPTTTHKPTLRLDLTLQFVQDMFRRDPFARSLNAQSIGPLGKGEIFSDMTVHIELQPGWAYMLVPEDPERDWSSNGIAQPIAAYNWGELLGPPAPPVPTLGEALLTTLGAPSDVVPRRDLRAVVLLIPRVPDTFRLLRGDASLASN